MTEPHERHNIVTRKFLQSLRTEGVTGEGIPGILIVLESLMLAIMRINVDNGVAPQRSAELVELAYQRALEDFTRRK